MFEFDDAKAKEYIKINIKVMESFRDKLKEKYEKEIMEVDEEIRCRKELYRERFGEECSDEEGE